MEQPSVSKHLRVLRDVDVYKRQVREVIGVGEEIDRMRDEADEPQRDDQCQQLARAARPAQAQQIGEEQIEDDLAGAVSYTHLFLFLRLLAGGPDLILPPLLLVLMTGSA